MADQVSLSPLQEAYRIEKSGVAFQLYREGQCHYALVTLREISEECLKMDDKFTMMMSLFNLGAYRKASEIALSMQEEDDDDMIRLVLLQCCLMLAQYDLALFHSSMFQDSASTDVQSVVEQIEGAMKEPMKPWIAAIGGHTEVLRKLVQEESVDINGVYSSKRLGPGHPSLQSLAVANSNVETCHMLLELGADVEYINNGFNCLQLCILLGDYDICIELLNNKADPNIKPNNSVNAGQFAVVVNRCNFIKLLFAKGADFKAAMPIIPNMGIQEELFLNETQSRVVDTHLKGNALSHACVKGFHTMAETLLQLSIFDINEPHIYACNATYLHLACGRGNVGDICYLGVTEILLKYKANVNCETLQGYTPLHFAARIQDPTSRGIIPQLVDAGAETEKLTKTMETPMQAALASGSVAGVMALLSCNVDLFECESRLLQPVLSWLILSEMTMLVASIQQHYKKLDNQDILNKLMTSTSKNGTSAVSFSDATPLHWACLKGNYIVVQLLILCGVNITATCDMNGKKYTALQCTRYYNAGALMKAKKEDMRDCDELLTKALGDMAKNLSTKKKRK